MIVSPAETVMDDGTNTRPPSLLPSETSTAMALLASNALVALTVLAARFMVEPEEGVVII